LDRLFYRQRLPNGGEREVNLARKLRKMSNTSLKGIAGLGVLILAEQYRQTKNWYYTMKPISDSAVARWTKMMKSEKEKPPAERNQDLIYFCELRINGPDWVETNGGIPTLVANFRMTTFFTLLRADGKRDRVVEIITNKGERRGRVRLDAESFSTPSGRTGFRVWLANHSNGVWRGGERELEDLQLDAAHEAAYAEVHEITAVGHDAACGIWFMGDCAYARNGSTETTAELLADEDGVYWHEGVGYTLGAKGAGNQGFLQKQPMMHPTLVLQFDDREVDGTVDEKAEQRFCLVPRSEAKHLEGPVVARLFGETASRLEIAIGSYDAFYVMGWFLSFYGGPEFLAREECFPGLFLHGETSQGKSTTVRWGMELMGVHNLTEGIGLGRNSSAVGMQIALDQNSFIPVWLGDFKNNEITEEKLSIMHAAFNRSVSAKWSMEDMRQMKTMFVVDGESRPSKTSTRFRYGQVLISKANRKGPNQVSWFQRNRRFLFSISRELLRRRGEFARLMMQHFDVIAKELEGVEYREVQVHGAPYGAFVAASIMLGNLLPKRMLDDFRSFVRQKCALATEQRDQAVNVNQFWKDLISAIRRELFGVTPKELQRYFRVTCIEMDHPPGAANKDERGNYVQGRWKSYIFYIWIDGVLDLLRQELRKQGRNMALDKTDLLEQMSRRSYWSPKNRGRLKQRFTGAKSSLDCWAIEVDELARISTESN
jgi:hypothetical protein